MGNQVQDNKNLWYMFVLKYFLYSGLWCFIVEITSEIKILYSSVKRRIKIVSCLKIAFSDFSLLDKSYNRKYLLALM